MRFFSGFKTATIDIDRTPTEFTGDDVDRFSSLVDLGGYFSNVTLHIPTIDSAAVSLYVQNNSLIATVPKIVHYRQCSDNATAAASTTAGTGDIVFTFSTIAGPVRFLRVHTGANQTADRAFTVVGFD